MRLLKQTLRQISKIVEKIRYYIFMRFILPRTFTKIYSKNKKIFLELKKY